ncbi:hypothetical protein [Methylococcus geothermalis]|uniref:Uncharacterized protein n=1 Tax=Methylococcus geothermalis TaxID=2681310 RepID=A0A858Q6D6_9GAMM|nr:hypothetical protein [Methylococcus geothermalis]QJD29365.1 hypothetical protein GNH96_04885 [Methylococcus geothermalis]
MTSAAGWMELDQAKLAPLLRMKYHDTIADALADRGRPEEIGRMFAGFQNYLSLSARRSRVGMNAQEVNGHQETP